MQIAFWLYFLIFVFVFAWGAMFILRRDFMPYHAVAVGMPWSDVPPKFQLLILGLLKLVGGVLVTLSLSGLAVLFWAFRDGALWAKWLLPALILIQSVATLNAMRQIIRQTEAEPPVPLVIGLAVAAVIALGFSFS